MRLRCVLEQRQSVTVCESSQLIHCARLPVQMYSQNRRRRRADCRPCCLWVDQTAPAIDVNANGCRAGVPYRKRARDEGVSGNDHLIPVPDPARDQDDGQGGGAGCHSDAVTCAAVVRKLGFEAFHLLAKNECATAEQAIEHSVELRGKWRVLAR